MTEPKAIGIGRIRDLRLPPKPSIPSRRGPAPKPAPWIAGLIIEQLVDKGRDDGAPSTLVLRLRIPAHEQFVLGPKLLRQMAQLLVVDRPTTRRILLLLNRPTAE